jgi:hypothetical protein
MVYAGTIVAILALVGGFTIAASNVLLSHHTQNSSGDNIGAAGPVNGVSYVSTELNVTNTQTMTVQTVLGGPTAPVTLGGNMNVFCMSGNVGGSSPCVSGDFGEWANYSFSTSFSGTMSVTMYMYTSTYSAAQTLYVEQAGTPVSGNLVLVWDLGTSTVSVNSITITLNECQGASSCP